MLIKGKKIVIILLFLFLSNVYAEEHPTQNEDVRYLKADLNRDGVDEEINLKTVGLRPGGAVCFLSVDDKEFGPKIYLDIEYVGYCNLSVIQVDQNSSQYIGVGYGVGTHSYKLSLFRYVKPEGKDDYFLINVGTFFSDWPMIKVEDVDGDGIKEIIEVQRGYEDAFTQAEIKIYKHKEGYKDESFFSGEYIEGAQWEVSSSFTSVTMTDDFNLYNKSVKDLIDNAKKSDVLLENK